MSAYVHFKINLIRIISNFKYALSVLLLLGFALSFYPIAKLFNFRFGVMLTGIIGHLIPTLSHLDSWIQHTSQVKEGSLAKRPKRLFIFAARGVSNHYVLSLLKPVVSPKIKIYTIPFFVSKNLDLAFNNVISGLVIFDSTKIEVEKSFMWVNMEYTEESRNLQLPRLNSMRLPYFSGKFHFQNRSQGLEEFGIGTKLKSKPVMNPLTVGVIDRDEAYKGANPLRDTQKMEMLDVCRSLKQRHFKVYRLGNQRKYKLPYDCVDLDFPFLNEREDMEPSKEIRVFERVDVCITWKTGYQELPLMFGVPTVLIDEFWRNDKQNIICIPPVYHHKIEKRLMLLPEMIARYGMDFEDNIGLRHSVVRMPANAQTIQSAIDSLFQHGISSSDTDGLRLEYVACLLTSIEGWHKQSNNRIFGQRWDLERLINDLDKFSMRIEPRFLIEQGLSIESLKSRLTKFSN